MLRSACVKDNLNTLGPHERPAACVGRPGAPAADSVVSDAEGTPSPVKRGKRGRLRKQSAVAQPVPSVATPKRPRRRPRKQR
ncbi:hypothetical protein ABBQ32_011578 [Trebouxia sp. C0010 RCD-2024]